MFLLFFEKIWLFRKKSVTLQHEKLTINNYFLDE